MEFICRLMGFMAEESIPILNTISVISFISLIKSPLSLIKLVWYSPLLKNFSQVSIEFTLTTAISSNGHWHGELSQPGSLKAALVSFCLIASKPLKDAVLYPVCRWGTWQCVRFWSLFMHITNKCWNWDSDSSLYKLRVLVLGHDSTWRSAWLSVSAQKAKAVIKMLAVVRVYHAWYLWSIHSGFSKHLIELGTLSVWERGVARASSLSMGEKKGRGSWAIHLQVQS